MNGLQGKTILVTGGTGTVGAALVKKILEQKPKQLRVFSRDESKQYELLEKLNHPKNLRFLIGDIRDRDRLNFAFQNVDVVFHAAALKHVPFCEYNPFETVKTNVLGSQNVVDAALSNRVKKVIAVSTDKVVDPLGIMGTSKLMMEKLFINANYYSDKTGTRFSCVRFGNVAWARGSVLALWKNQANHSRTLKITDKKMTRFIMSIDLATELILEAMRLCQGGEIFVFKMPAVKVPDLAKMFIKKYFPLEKIKIQIVGNRGGEKLHEELLGNTDCYRKIWENHRMFILLPWVKILSGEQIEQSYAGFRPGSRKTRYSSRDSLKNSLIAKII